MISSPTPNFADQNIEEGILNRISNGDGMAVSECLDRYGKLVWSLARKFTSTREDAEDAVQEIFIDLWKYAARFDSAKSPEGAFVTLVARRRLIDRLRKTKNQPQTDLFESAMATKANGDDKKLQTKVEMKIVFAALETLRLSERQVLQMAIYEGMSNSEIADHLSLPLGTVKSLIRRSYQKIRIALGVTFADGTTVH